MEDQNIDALICTVGTSGPVVTETVDFLHKKTGSKPLEVHLILTSDESVNQNGILIETALRNRFGRDVIVKSHTMPQADIENYNSLIDFMRWCKNIVVEIRESFPKAKIGFLISGGRKTESVAASFVAVYMGADAVFHVYSSVVTPFNIGLERSRELIKELALAEDKDGFYIQNKETLDSICFPPRDTYEVIPFLIPPLPPNFISRLVASIKSCPASKSKIRDYLTSEELDECIDKGFFYTYGTDCILADKGRDLLKVFGD